MSNVAELRGYVRNQARQVNYQMPDKVYTELLEMIDSLELDEKHLEYVASEFQKAVNDVFELSNTLDERDAEIAALRKALKHEKEWKEMWCGVAIESQNAVREQINKKVALLERDVEEWKQLHHEEQKRRVEGEEEIKRLTRFTNPYDTYGKALKRIKRLENFINELHDDIVDLVIED